MTRIAFPVGVPSSPTALSISVIAARSLSWQRHDEHHEHVEHVDHQRQRRWVHHDRRRRSSTTTGSGGSGGESCHGDATTWAALTSGPITCTKNSDCCVILNGCLSAAQIVSEANQATAKSAWPYCDTHAGNHCIPPAIVVGCEDGECAGKEVDFSDASPDLMMDHSCRRGPRGGPELGEAALRLRRQLIAPRVRGCSQA